MVQGVCHCEQRTDGDLNGEGPLPGLNGNKLSAGPPGKILEVSLEWGNPAKGKAVAEILPTPR